MKTIPDYYEIIFAAFAFPIFLLALLFTGTICLFIMILYAMLMN